MSTAPSFENGLDVDLNRVLRDDFTENGPTEKPFSSIDAMEILEKTLSITEELLSLVAKRTEFYREPLPDQSEGSDVKVKHRSSSGMTDMIMHSVAAVESHNRTLNYILNTLR